MAFRVANCVFGLLFFVSALLQLNDPDPVPWLAIYLAAGLACLEVHRPLVGWMPIAGIGLVAFIWALALAPDALSHGRFQDLARTMKAETPEVELLREMCGLAIVAAWMALLARRRFKSPARPAGRGG